MTQANKSAFTLVEVLVASAIMLIVVVVLLEVIGTMTDVWRSSSGSISNYESARSAFTTINRVLSRATLNTYVDYVDKTTNPPFGAFRQENSTATFYPAAFARASELHFLCGPATQFAAQTHATAADNPGDVIFFQAPLGVVTTSSDKYLRSSLNAVGFYIQHGDINTSILPTFLQNILGINSHRYGYRLLQYIQPTESLSIYNYTTLSPNYSIGWLPAFDNTQIASGNAVLAENVLLLLFRPRLEPQDESVAAQTLGVSYNVADPTTTGSVISPNYNYDSRTWMTGYSFGTGVKSSAYGLMMRNQLPPIVDVVMVCADAASLNRVPGVNSATAPASLAPAATLFTRSDDASFNADLATYGQQLTALHVRYKIFHSSVQMQSAAWASQ